MQVLILEPPSGCPVFPKEGEGSFRGHEFFEASSIRKIGDTYYFVYSSRHNHELCYAVSKRPDGDFVFGGTLVDIGDCFLDGRTEDRALNYMGNTHGSIVSIRGEWYVFYHRQTNRHSFSRQACAERLRFHDGQFEQAEITSCGLNGGPLKAEGEYEARIACNLWAKNGATGRYDKGSPRRDLADHPYFTQSGKDRMDNGDQYIANMCDGSAAGFKYFDFSQVGQIDVQTRGSAGILEISLVPDFSSLLGQAVLPASAAYVWSCAPVRDVSGTVPLYFRYRGDGSVDFRAFRFSLKEA
ncbi:MAG: hypothetical protein HUK26_06555 [Duodenibacillus sp.]|nr:hypothetical protein [Duodenibacillus sp.]